ncbi:carbohydrate binding domain-containing protein [Clostridium sp. YIM B02505]|uniref:Carbohydrate binding domain-containing protein n=1 Tax=Clostridium yunnanense TaxID=2800325 RepID=A0ABS1EPI3_9CLOT|nr:carbohydrate binding domain-containing protein [Clostridium yunnanense]MBK1811249.1 carbohydrate binding domain-containing protein [Clostridium yunnanense]
MKKFMNFKGKKSRNKAKRGIGLFMAGLFVLGDVGLSPALVALGQTTSTATSSITSRVTTALAAIAGSELALNDQFPLKNGDFSNGMTKWSDFVQGRYDGWDKVTGASVQNGELKYTVSSVGNNPWDVMLMQNDFKMYGGQTYVVSLDIRSSAARNVEIVVDDANGTRYISKNEAITATQKTLSYELPVTADMTTSFKVLLGKIDGNGTLASHDVYVDNVRVEVKGARDKAFLLKNGYFTDGTNNWTEFVQGRSTGIDTETKYAVENGGMKFHVAKVGSAATDVSLSQGNLSLVNGKTYTIYFNGRSTIPRNIQVVAANSANTRYLDKTVKLDSYVQTYSFDFTMGKDDVAALKFLLGKVDATSIGVHDVFIDNVRFELKGAKDAAGEAADATDNIHLPFGPVLSPDADKNELGQDIKITFADNLAWRNAISAVTIDGNTIDSSNYTKAAGYILIKASQFTQLKDYAIAVRANGFEKTDVVQPIQAKSDWSLAWNDEFDGSGTNVDTNGVNLDKWGYQNGTGAEYGIDGWGNNEKQYYQKENIKEQNGNLVIEAKPEAKNGKTYTSGRLWTSPTFSQRYGKFEARMKLPKGQGFWPAFWMLPKNSEYGTWASSGEIDIMEARGREVDKVDGTIHYGKPWPNNKATGASYNFPAGQDITGFHTYSLEWEPGEIRWYVDGILYQTTNNWFSQSEGQPDKNAYPAPFDKSFYIVLNLAVGGSYDAGKEPSSSDFPAKMEVDYVRAYNLTGRAYKQPVEPVLTKDTLPSNAKQPIDGNYVHDVNFNQPITDVTTGSLNTENWNFVHVPDAGGAGSVSIDTINNIRFAKVNIANAGTQNYALQLIQNLSLAKGRYYKLTFDAKAAASRNISVKFGGGADKGWPTYSDNFDVSLKTSVQSYEYRFQMQGATDIAARMEFNMGTNNSAVWVGNVKVQEVDGLYDSNAAKTPLDDGNHVYNGSFKLGTMQRMAFWNFSTASATATASVNPDTTELGVSITNGGVTREAVQLSQKGINLLQNDTYQLTFDARAAAARDMEVKFLSKSGTTVYTAKTLNLTTTTSKQTVIFTMPAGITDTEGQLVFNLGGKNINVYLDNISLIRTTNNNVDYSVIDLFPLKNGDFSLGLNKWEQFLQGGAATFDGSNGEAKVSVSNLGGEAWNVMLNQSNLKLFKGFDYVLSFDARSSVNRDIEAVLENGSYTRKFASGSLATTPTSKHFEYNFRVSSDDTVALKFLLGKTGQGAVGDVFIDNVVLQIKNPPVKKPPMLVADSTTNNVGQPIDIVTGQDSSWISAVAAVKVNGTTLAKSSYTLTAGKLSIVPGVFTTEGSYTVTVEATGYDKTTVTQTVYSVDGNVVLNGNMALGNTNWEFWNNAPDWSSYSISNGVANIKINYHGAKDNEWKVPFSWSTQFSQKNIQLSANKTYELSFKAWSTVNRPIIVELTNYQGSPKLNFNITSDQNAVYKYTIKPTQDTNMNLTYLLGYIEDGTNVTPTGEHNIYLDDVSIKDVNGTGNPAPTTNLALNKKGNASTNVQPVQNAFDGNIGTRWESEASNTQWVSVDLGGLYKLDRVDLNWEGAYGKTYKIQGSTVAAPTTDSDWTDLYTEVNGKAGVVSSKLSGQQVRHVRIYGLERGTIWGYSLWEFEVYGTAVSSTSADKTTLNSKITEAQGKVQAEYTAASWSTLQNALTNALTIKNKADATQTEVDNAVATLTAAINGLVKASVATENIALNKTATASSGTTSLAFDGNKGTRWESAFNDTQWIAVNLGDLYTLDKVVLNWEAAYGKQYKIQVATVANPTETDWKDAYTESNSDGNIDEIAMNKVQARHVRMYGTLRGLPPYGFSLWEFEVYGSK